MKKFLMVVGAALWLVLVSPAFAEPVLAKQRPELKTAEAKTTEAAGEKEQAPVALEDPLAMLRKVTDEVMQELKKHRAEIQRDSKKIYAVIDHLIIPHVDFIEMARWVVGRNAWRKASPAVQQAFVKEFKNMVVRSYSRSLLEYTNQVVEFLPLREAIAKQERIQISSLIKESGQPPTHMNYYLIRDEKAWKVYDIIIEGVSLVQGYRAQFAEDVQQGGVAQVLETIRQRNASR